MGIITALGAAEITPDSLAADLRAEWISSDGLVRLEVTPKGDSNDRLVMTKFAEAVQAVAPNASGPPVIVSVGGPLNHPAPFLRRDFTRSSLFLSSSLSPYVIR